MAGCRTSDLPVLMKQASLPLALSVGLGGAGAVLLILQMEEIATLVTDLAFRKQAVAAEQSVIGLLIGITILRCGVLWLADMAGERAGMAVASRLRRDLMTHLFRVGPVGMTGTATGAVVTALTDGVDALRPYIAHYIPRAATMVVVPLLILARVAGLDGWSFLILACTGPLIPVFMALAGYGAQAVMDRQWNRLLLLGSSFLDALQGLTTLRLFGRARESAAIVRELSEAHRTVRMQVMRVAFLTSAVLEFFSSVAIALTAVVLGSRLLSASIPFRTAFLVLLLAPEYFAPLRAFSASYHARQNALSAMAGISELQALPELAGDAPASVDAARPHLIWLADVSVGYGDGPDVIRHLSCSFPKGTLTVITGASGCGKSTLLRLLAGLMPPRSGEIRASDCHGQRVPQKAWRIGWVAQLPGFPDGTIADVLRLAAPEADEARLRQVAEQAGILTFITAQPEGFRTRVGENGAGLSGGEVRRLALARALLTDPDVLIFDEPTADLDPVHAAAVADTVRKMAAGRIVIAVSHRADLLNHADQVLLLPEGRMSRSYAGRVAA